MTSLDNDTLSQICTLFFTCLWQWFLPFCYFEYPCNSVALLPVTCSRTFHEANPVGILEVPLTEKVRSENDALKQSGTLNYLLAGKLEQLYYSSVFDFWENGYNGITYLEQMIRELYEINNVKLLNMPCILSTQWMIAVKEMNSSLFQMFV